ncbi:hypothetical protein J5N58_01215 [Rhizobium cremeum]|uniref:hypothetical protein n=1 Tax=Rhizobium cremeum TaxID=2813827 RepID=UPI001FD3D306|nr:hypothetical protein [Rhizobium cremeum]MCJ7993216.1 hypothetical protein [Rhizobium cremeum]MCJ7998281.1 hypothetical protein [Rhizobium cremeum]
MARVAGSLKSSVNAGQLSKSLFGKVNLKQYYSGASLMQGLEPIPQAGFTLLPGSRRVGAAASATVAKGVLRVSNTLSYTLVITPGSVDIWRNDLVKVATVAAAELTAGLIPYLTFYGEANTFGIFHPDLPSGLRLLRNSSNDTIWTKSTWPYDLVPDVDLGGSYAQTVDQWDLFIRWATGVPGLTVSCSVDGTTVPSVSLGTEPDSASPGDWNALAAAMQGEISSLPGFGSGVSVSFLGSATRFVNFRVQFGGPLTGSEYEFDVQVVSTSDASALVSHVAIGETAGEPLISVARGGFAGMTLFQDRACYFGPKARQTAIAMSRVAEYFDLNIEATADNGARLEALRSATSESIYHLLDTTYLLAFTDQAEYFASNRTIERNKPLNWVRASEIGSKRTCRPVTLEGKAYFVSADGGRLYAFAYDAVTEMFQPEPVNDLNEDLVSDIRSMAVQKKQGDMRSDRLWILREDGRVVCCLINRTQEIMAAVEWVVAGGGTVHGLSVDGQGQVWLTIERAGAIAEEVLEEGLFFQHSAAATTNADGIAGGLSIFNGKQIWGFFNNDVYGPVTVSGGAADFGIASATGVAGLWQAPVYESMPYVRVLGNDDVVRRPGKVVSGRFYLKDTASIAIGANGQAVKDQPLDRASDDLAADKANFTGHLTVCGLKGVTMDPTITISQVRPGKLTVRDYIPGVKL